MTQVLHTPLGQPIFVGDSQAAARLLQVGVPLHLLTEGQSAHISGLQARPKTAPVAGRKVSADATLQSKEKWAKPREIPVPKKADPAKVKEIREKYTFKPPQKPAKKLVKAQSQAVEVKITTEDDPVPEESVPILTSEEHIRTVRIEDILKEAKKRQGEVKAKERYEVDLRKSEQKKKEERVQKLLSEANTRIELSRKPETKHSLPWGANQRRQLEEQEKIKECAQIRKSSRETRVPLSADRVGLGEYLEVRKEVNPRAIPLRKSQPQRTETTDFKQLKAPDLEVEMYMKEKRREEKKKAVEDEEKAHQMELERLFRLKELEDLRQRKLADYKKRQKLDNSKANERRGKQKRIKQILAKARAKLQQYQQPENLGSEEAFSVPSNSVPVFSEDQSEEQKSEHWEEEIQANRSPSPKLKAVLDSSDSEPVQEKDEELPAKIVRRYDPPAPFRSEATKLGEDKQISFVQQEHTHASDLSARKAEIRKKLSELQRRISGHLPQDPLPVPVVLAKYPSEPVVLEQDIPGVKSAEKTYTASLDKPTQEITYEAIPGNDRVQPGLQEDAAATVIQTCVRGYLARRRVQRLRVRRSLAEIDPELRKQMLDMDREVMHIMEKAYAPVQLQAEPASQVPFLFPQTAVSVPISSPESIEKRLVSHLQVKTEEDEYSLFKVIMRSGAFVSSVPKTEPVEEDIHSIREEETPEYSESFCTPSKSSQSESIESSIRDQPYQETPRSEDVRTSPPLFTAKRLPFPTESPTKEPILSIDRKRTVSPGLEVRAKDGKPKSGGKVGEVGGKERPEPRRSGRGIDEDGSKSKGISGSLLTDSISEDLPASGRKRPDSSISEHLSIDEFSKSSERRRFDVSPEQPSARSISESISEETPAPASGRRRPDSSISEHLSIDEFSKSYGKPTFDQSERRESGQSIAESIPEESGLASGPVPPSNPSISERISLTDLSKSREKAGILTTESIAEMLDSHASQDSSLRFSPSVHVQKPAESISEDLSGTQSASVHRLSSPSDPSKSHEKPGLQVTDSIEEELLESHSSASNVSVAVSSKGKSSDSGKSGRHKFDSPATGPEDHGIEESISEELSHAQVSIESRKDEKPYKDSYNIIAVEDYSEDFESESLHASLSRRQETKEEESVSERISENQSELESKSMSKSEDYSSDFEASQSHRRLDTPVSPDKMLKTSSIEEEGIEEELSSEHKSPEGSSSEEPQYDDDFESSSPGSYHEEDTLHTSSSLPRSTIGGDPEVSGNSESIEWTVELSPRPSATSLESEERISGSSTDLETGKKEQTVAISVTAIVDILMTEAFDLFKAAEKKPADVSPFSSLTLPPLPPLVVKSTKTQLLPTEQSMTQELTSLTSDLLKQALRNKAVLSALTKSARSASEARTLVGRLSGLNATPKRPVMSEEFFSLWSAQGELLESGSLSEDLQGKKPLKRVVFDTLNQLFERHRKPDDEILPWNRISTRKDQQKIDTEKVRKAMEKELGELLQTSNVPIREPLGASQRSIELLQQKRNDEQTAKLLEFDLKRDIWGQYDTEESVIKLQLAEEILKTLASELSVFLQTGNEIR